MYPCGRNVLNLYIYLFLVPNVLKISYSTCSIHHVENEEVVSGILNKQKEFKLADATEVLPEWSHRGELGHGLNVEDTAKVVKASPADGTNGFFVALFVRCDASGVAKEDTGISSTINEINMNLVPSSDVEDTSPAPSEGTTSHLAQKCLLNGNKKKKTKRKRKCLPLHKKLPQ
jgi:putative methyltransferase